MTFLIAALIAAANATSPPPSTPTTSSDDPFGWLEEINGAKAIEWVKARNAESEKAIASSPDFATTKKQILEVLDSTEKIPYVERHGDALYNFWRDKDHVQGILRRTTLDEYTKKDPKWETVLDVDALSKAENEKWVYEGASCLDPEHRMCLMRLSKGGGDAVVVREFDMKSKSFVKDGFVVPEAKTDVSFVDANTIFVGTDFGKGSMTSSGYPRITKLWKRGTPLASATTVYEGKNEDVAVSAFHDNTPGFERDYVSRAIDFYQSELFLRGKDGKLVLVDVPKDAIANVEREWLTVQPRTPWNVGGKTYGAGSLIAMKFDDFMKGKRDFTTLFTPTATTSLAGSAWTRHKLLLSVLDDVKSRVVVLTPSTTGEWKKDALGGAPEMSAVEAYPGDADRDDEVWLTVTGFLTPTTYMRGVIGEKNGEPKALKQTPAWFDASPYVVTQAFAKSKDGTRVPYFVVAPKGMKLDGKNPTLLYGYGGFEVSLTPWYSGGIGRVWLSKGGVYVVANIRGGGEYGPQWHQAAVRENRLRAYEDFAAVAEDLVARKITSREHLAMNGGSNGGLLMGNMVTLYPDLAGAVSCEVPLLDMKRYTHLSAGASWIAEYGDPDKADEWAFIQKFSPYQNVKKGTKYPKVFFLTSTKDDRVGPAHARKMAARMLADGDDVMFWENIEGGHGAAADNEEAAMRDALSYGFLWKAVK